MIKNCQHDCEDSVEVQGLP